jgi:hypothetical protein
MTPTPTPPPAISVSLSAVKHYSPSSTGNAGLYLSGRVYTTVGGIGVPGRSIVLHISYVVGGTTVRSTITLGPTDANGFATACPASNYPANVQLTISTDPVDNLGGVAGPGLPDVQVQNQALGAVPAFCP